MPIVGISFPCPSWAAGGRLGPDEQLLLLVGVNLVQRYRSEQSAAEEVVGHPLRVVPVEVFMNWDLFKKLFWSNWMVT